MLCCTMLDTEIAKVVWVTLNNVKDAIVKFAGKVAVSKMLRWRDHEVVGAAVVYMVAPKGDMIDKHGVDHVANGRLVVARYVNDAENAHAEADQKTTTRKSMKKLTERVLQDKIYLLKERQQKLNAKLLRKVAVEIR